MAKGTNPRNFAAGYGRPPTSTQFKPGQSGNKKGRPKGVKSAAAMAQAELNQILEATIKGRRKKITALEAMMKKQSQDALMGNQKALLFLLGLADKNSEKSPVYEHTLLPTDLDKLSQAELSDLYKQRLAEARDFDLKNHRC